MQVSIPEHVSSVFGGLLLLLLLGYSCALPAADGRPRVPLPANEVSQYFETVSSGITWDTKKRCGRFTLTLKPTAAAPRSFRLEAHFPDPAKPGREKVVATRGCRNDSRILLESPPLRGFDCGNYQVFVHIYGSRDRAMLLGTHYQFIQSTVDLSRVRSEEQLISAILQGSCRD